MGWRDSFIGRAITVVLAAFFFGVMGWVATNSMDALVASQTARDWGITTIWIVVVIGACAWMVLKAPALVPAASFRPNRGKGAKGTLQIITATYGDPNSDDRRADVTTIVQRNVGSGRLDMVVENSSFGGDPAPGIKKTLNIKSRRPSTSNIASTTDRSRERCSMRAARRCSHNRLSPTVSPNPSR